MTRRTMRQNLRKGMLFMAIHVRPAAPPGQWARHHRGYCRTANGGLECARFSGAFVLFLLRSAKNKTKAVMNHRTPNFRHGAPASAAVAFGLPDFAALK